MSNLERRLRDRTRMVDIAKRRIEKQCECAWLFMSAHAIERLHRTGKLWYQKACYVICGDIRKNIDKLHYQWLKKTYSLSWSKHYYIFSKDLLLITIWNYKNHLQS